MRRLILFLLVLAPVPALGVDMDFHTYNGFDETVAMFTRLALIFSDAGFRTYFTIFAIVGILIAVLGSALTGAIAGTGSNPASGFVPIIIGVAIVRGLVFPTGNVIIFDPVRNATATVAGVPDLIVLLAGGLNSIERGLVSIFETANAHPYGGMTSSISYALIRAAHRGNLNDYYLEQSLSNYYLDCGIPALGQGATSRRQNLLHNTTNPMTEFSAWQNVALFTTYHPAGDDGGELRSCTNAWDGLQTRLTAVNTFNDYTASVCESAGFDPNTAAQLAQCRTALARATGLFGVPAATTEVPLLRAMVMAKSVSNALNSADFSQAQRTLVNRQIIAEGFGTSQAMDQWIPKVRVFLTVLALGCVPVVVLFMVTPAYQAAMVLLMGLFSWLAMWGACDAMAVQMAQDAALDAFAQIQRQRLGIDAMLESPEAAIQALGVFGKARMVAITLATVLSGALFKFGGYAFARLGEQWQSHLEQAGEQSGRQTMLPEENAQLQRSLVGAAAFQGSMSQVGFDHMAGGQAMGEMQPGLKSAYISNELGMNGGSFSAMQARTEAVNTVGTDQGFAAAAARSGQSYSESSIGAIAQSAGESHVSASARQDFGSAFYGDALAPAAQEAQFGVARTAATSDAVEAHKAAHGGSMSDSDAVRETFRVLGAGDRAKAGEFTSQEAIASEGFKAQSDNSFTQTMADRGMGGAESGRARAFFEAGQTKATLTAGADAIEMSEMVSRGEATGRGAVANELSGGQPFRHGQELGVRQGAIGAAEMWRDESVAQALGMNPNEIRDNVQYQQMSNSQVQLALSPDAANRIASNPNVDLAPEQRRFMQENPDAGYVQSFNLNSDGGWVAGSLKAGTDFASGNFSQFRDGTVREQRDDNIISQRRDYDATESMAGANRLLESGHTEALMGRAFNLDGSVNQSSLASFGKAYGEALSDRGFTLSRQHADELRDHSNISKFGSASGGLGGSLGFASGRAEAGIRASFDDSKGWSKSDSVHENRNLLLMQSLGAGAMEQAKTEYRDQHGALPSAGSAGSDQIYARAGELFRKDFESLANDSQARVDKTPDELNKPAPENTWRPDGNSGRNKTSPDNAGDLTWRPANRR